MKKLSHIVFLSLILLTGCRPGIADYWNKNSIDYSDVDSARERFVTFAELAATAQSDEACDAIDILFDKLVKDPVAYYLYSDWIEAAFYNLLSPCRNAALYSKAVERIVKDGILPESDFAPFVQKLNWIQYNQAGHQATVPGVSLNGQRTLVLVLDQTCSSCRQALKALESYEADRKIALCCTYGPVPEEPGWEVIAPENAQAVFDPQLTPVFFVVSADGTVETSYTLAM